MKSTKLTFLLISVALAANAQDKQDKTDLEKENLHGKVRTIAVTGYTVERIDGKLQKGRPIHTTTSNYNDKGNILEYISTDGVDTVQDQYVQFKAVRNSYKYDNNGVL